MFKFAVLVIVSVMLVGCADNASFFGKPGFEAPKRKHYVKTSPLRNDPVITTAPVAPATAVVPATAATVKKPTLWQRIRAHFHHNHSKAN